MRKLIEQLESLSRQLEPDETQRDAWHDAAKTYAHQFIDHLPDDTAYKTVENPGAALAQVQFGDEPVPMEDILSLMKTEMNGVGLNPASGGHLGYIPGGGIYPTALGDYLAAVTNQYAGIFFGSPGSVRIENRLIRWMCELMGYPPTALGNLSSGGSIANLIAFVTARDFKKITSTKVRKSVIYLTEQVHHCVHKAIRIGGLAEAKIRNVPMDERYRMDAAALARLVEADKAQGLRPFLVVASAGTTDTGAVDPLAAIAAISQEHDLWFHVDAAYGGFFVLADVENPDGSNVRDAFRGIEASDSIAIDPHKGLFLSYGLGAVLIKNVKALHETHYYRANYMQDTLSATEELSPADLSPELTKHFRGLRLWLPLQLYGLRPFKAALTEKIMLCRYFYEEVKKLGFETGPFPDLSVAIYRYLPPDGSDANDFNRRLVEHVQRDGRVFVSSTTLDGVFWIRIAILSFRTHLREVDLYLKILKEGLFLLPREQSC